jgi:rubrerythrin
MKLTNSLSRRHILVSGAIAGMSGALTFSAIKPSLATNTNNNSHDAEILNKALYYEHQAIWAYGVAAGKLSDSDVGNTVKAIALNNQQDHQAHRDTLAKVVESLGGTPVEAAASYDISTYLDRGEGNLDSDVNIAKLALALEVDAAIAYTQEIANLKTPELITAGASIGSDEAAHATAIRAAFIALGTEIDYVPASFISVDTRQNWILTV